MRSTTTDPFDDVPLAPVRDAALEAARHLGCEHADVRVEAIRTQHVTVRDAKLETDADEAIRGLGIRVVRDGWMGFAGTIELTADGAAGAVALAVELARASATAGAQRVSLASEPSHGVSSWTAPYEIDPTGVPNHEKAALLESWSGSLLAHPSVEHVVASVEAVRETKHYADLAGTVTTQRRVRIHPVVEVFGRDRSGEGDSVRSLAPPVGRGWEYLLGEGFDHTGDHAELGDLLAEKLSAPAVEPGRYDLVVDPSNLWLTIHESVGHALELDRALGFEAAYAGTSFATPDGLGRLRYGSPAMTVTGDRTVPHGLATVAYDDEGVTAQSFPLVTEGVLTGFQVDRATAALAGLDRSNGCAYACSPLNIPIQRMANVSLAPAAGEGPTTSDLLDALGDGLFVVGDRSWSIDMERHNFQFSAQRFVRIRHGRPAGQVRFAAYQGSTTDFWASLEAVGGHSTFVLGGALNCGKGQPGQSAPVSHGCPAALFRRVNVLSSRSEAGR